HARARARRLRSAVCVRLGARAARRGRCGARRAGARLRRARPRHGLPQRESALRSVARRPALPGSGAAHAPRAGLAGAGVVTAPPRVGARAVTALFPERQHLDRPRGRRLSAASLTRFAEDVGGIQLDTINVVERAHHLTLWSRFDVYARPTFERLGY